MTDYKETAINYIVGEKMVTVYTGERKWISRLMRYKEKHPTEIVIDYINEDGSMLAHVPIKWFKFPAPQKTMSNEQKLAAAERMKAYQEKAKAQRQL